jgi:predicted DNA-binding transcriptional regulator YafY
MASQIRNQRWHQEQKIIARENGSVEIIFPVASGGSKQPYANVLEWVLGMGSHAEVLAPEAFKQRVKDEIHKMVENLVH